MFTFKKHLLCVTSNFNDSCFQCEDIRIIFKIMKYVISLHQCLHLPNNCIFLPVDKQKLCRFPVIRTWNVKTNVTNNKAVLLVL